MIGIGKLCGGNRVGCLHYVGSAYMDCIWKHIGWWILGLRVRAVLNDR